MQSNILLYGATGYSGQLIAGELALWAQDHPGTCRVVLAGRHRERLQNMSAQFGMDYRVFGLEDTHAMALALRDIAVVVNAAGPYAWTACELAAAAANAECSYVDICGEADVHAHLRGKFTTRFWDLDLALMCGAGFWAAASNLMLDRALSELAAASVPVRELGAIRIAMSRIRTFTRGSAATVWRSLRQQVTVGRRNPNASPDPATAMVEWRVPVGMLERSFDFGVSEDLKPDWRITSATSLVDTLAALEIAKYHATWVETIESYVEAGTAARIAYQFGSALSPLTAVAALRTGAMQPLAVLAEGPTQAERDKERHVVLLEIEDVYRSRVIDWRWETPNVYQFTAQLVTAVAAQIATRQFKGWLPPAVALRPLALPLTSSTGTTRNCKLHDRSRR